MAEVIGPASPDESLSNEQIIARYPSAITELIKSAQDNNYDFERQILLNKARLQWMFVRGEHFNAPGFMVTPYGTIADYVPFDFSEGSEETGPDVKLCPPINFIGGDLYKFKAIMGQTAPRVKCVADDAKNPDDMRAAIDADVNARNIWQQQKVDQLWDTIAFHLYTTGPAFIRAIWNCDAAKYGESIEPQIEIIEGPDGLPVPQAAGETAYPNGDVELEIESILTVATPWQAQWLEECDWMRTERMRSKWVLLERYKGTDDKPGPLEQYRKGSPPDSGMTASDQTAFEVADAVSTPSGVGRAIKANEWRHAEYWLKPHQLQSISDPEIRKLFQDHFKRGLYISRVGDITVDICEECNTDVWALCKVGREEKINERPICADAVPLQRCMNDLWGMSIETILRAITQTLYDSQILDRQALNTNEAVPAEFIPVAMNSGKLGDHVFQISPAHLSDQVPVLIQALRHAWQYDIVGITPELSGGGQPTQTWHEAQQRKNQALQVLSPQAKSMRFAAEKTAEISVKLRARFGSGTVKAANKTAYGKGTDESNMSDLKMTGWHAEADDNFPMTVSDRRDAVFSMLKDFPPEVQQALTILDPMNIEEIFQLLQIPGFESTIRDQVEKTLRDIDLLLGSGPVSGPPGPDGQPGPMTASIPPDPFENHMVATNVFAKWMVKEGMKTKSTNPQGLQNVFLRWQAQQALANPIPPPPPPIKPSLALSGKLEDMAGYMPVILHEAGIDIPGQPPPAAHPLPNQAPPPASANGQPGPPGSPASVVPQLMPPPNGPPPVNHPAM